MSATGRPVAMPVADRPDRKRVQGGLGRRRIVASLIGGGLLLAVAVVTGAGAAIWASRQDFLANAEREAHNTAMALADQTARVFDAVNLALDTVLQTAAGQGALDSQGSFSAWAGSEGQYRAMVARVDQLPQLDAIVLLRLDGINVGTTRIWPPRLNDNADREYFRAGMRSGSGTHVGEPIVSRGTGVWAVPLARRISAPDGRPVGVAGGIIKVDYFGGLYRSLVLGTGSTVMLLRRDGTILAQHPPSPASVGQNLAGSVIFDDLLTNRASVLAVGADGVERLLVGQDVAGWPLRVHVALSLDTVLQPWRVYAARLLVGACILLAVLVAAVMAAVRLVLNDAQATDEKLRLQEEVSTRQADFRLTVEGLTQGVWKFGRDGRMVLTNGRCSEVIGFPQDALRPGATLGELLESASEARAASAADAVRRLSALVARGQPDGFHQDLPAGRTAFVSYRPMTDGGWLATFEDVTERHAAEARVHYLARHDALTGLPNRLQLQEQLDAELQPGGAPRHKGGIALLYLDLDRFKHVNDTLGHPVGDALLHAAAARIVGSVRSTRADGDLVARLGGDEFAVLLRGSAADGARLREDAEAVASRLVSLLSEPFLVDGHQVVVGTTVGIAIAPSDAGTPADLLRAADLALYRAKADGRGRHHFFERTLDQEAKARLAIEVDLRGSLFEREGREFEVHFQPVLDLGTRRPTGCEALVRWRRPGHAGLLGPAAFISVAEDTSLILPLGALVLRRACEVASRWTDRSLHVAVNMSPAQFRRPGLVDLVEKELGRSGLEPDRLVIEVTESLLLARTAEALDAMHRLREIGVQFAMDDFGTGYSSLSYLRSFPFDRLKIDRSFVRDLETRPEDAAIVRSIATMCGELGITTVAEGVETEEQFRILAAARCREVQGYLFGQPVSADDLWTVGALPLGRPELPEVASRLVV